MKTLAVLGATGQTGHHLVAQALKKGHIVKALVRNEEKLRNILASEQQITEHKNLHIVKVSNIFDAEELKEPLKDVDVVMSTLGFGKGSYTGYEDVAKAISKALSSNENGSKRCIFMHSWYTDPESRAKASFFLRWVLFYFIGPLLDNMRKAEEFLEKQDEIDYSVILPSGLSKGKPTDCDFHAKEDAFYIEGMGGMIKRSDVARYMIKTMEEDIHHKKIVAIFPKN